MSPVTLAHNALPGPLSDRDDRQGWRLCPSGSDCDVVYFRGDRAVLLEQVRATPFHKSTDTDRRVCFCFGHTEQDIIDDVRLTGRSSIQESILAACRRGEDDCEKLNPQGHCCLGNVAQVVKAAGSPGDCTTYSG